MAWAAQERRPMCGRARPGAGGSTTAVGGWKQESSAQESTPSTPLMQWLLVWLRRLCSLNVHSTQLFVECFPRDQKTNPIPFRNTDIDIVLSSQRALSSAWWTGAIAVREE